MLRRSGLGLGLGLVAVAGSTALSGCTLDSRTPPAPDAFIALAASARSDAAMATALSAQAPDQAVALMTIAAERTAHAEAIEAELLRANGPAATSPEPIPADTAPQTPLTIDGLRAALADAQRAAADTARADTGYRSGLAGSISAACAAQNEVLLK